MRLQAYNDNGTMKFRQVSGSEAIDSLPVGTITAFYGTVAPNGYLLCDGSTFDTAKYPELYTLLGTNVLPDFRECVLVGAGENTTQTIASHDIYTVGEFKDDQMQSHTHAVGSWGSGGSSSWSYMTGPGGSLNYFTQENSGRRGTTTHGKQTGVNYLIKAATIGISDVSINAVKTALVGISGKLVWTNPSPTSSFGAQDIILSVPITGYDFIKIEHTIMAGGRQVDTYYIESGGAGIQDVVFASGPNITCSNRTFSFVDDTTVHFGTASSVAVAAQAANAVVNNGRTIPTRIWLCKQFRED